MRTGTEGGTEGGAEGGAEGAEERHPPPLRARVAGVRCARGDDDADPSDVDVVYFDARDPDEDPNAKGRLTRVCEAIVGAYRDAGLLSRRDDAAVRPRCVVMDSRDGGFERGGFDATFDATEITRRSGGADCGVAVLDEVHLSKLGEFDVALGGILSVRSEREAVVENEREGGETDVECTEKSSLFTIVRRHRSRGTIQLARRVIRVRPGRPAYRTERARCFDVDASRVGVGAGGVVRADARARSRARAVRPGRTTRRTRVRVAFRVARAARSWPGRSRRPCTRWRSPGRTPRA